MFFTIFAITTFLDGYRREYVRIIKKISSLEYVLFDSLIHI